MIYKETGSSSPYFNFGLEYYFANKEDLTEPILLLWRTQPTLMLGKYQNLYEEIQLEKARKEGVLLVRRMSGGGTIFTDLGAWQYSIIDPFADQAISFEKYMAPVIRTLRDLGIPAYFHGRNDILVDGKKISGNAQYRIKNTTVHHGSLLYQSDLDAMARLTTVRLDKIQSKGIQSIRSRVTNIADYMKDPLDSQVFKDYLVRSLVRLKAIPLSKEEILESQKYSTQIFDNKDVFYKTSPAFSLKKEKRLAGGLLSLSLDIHKGLIKDLEFTGDFFAGPDLERFKDALIGSLYEKENLIMIIQNNFSPTLFYQITSENLIDLFFSDNS